MKKIVEARASMESNKDKENLVTETEKRKRNCKENCAHGACNTGGQQEPKQHAQDRIRQRKSNKKKRRMISIAKDLPLWSHKKRLKKKNERIELKIVSFF